jgi:hypothetical protein
MSCGTHVNNTGTDFQVTIKDCNGSALDISDATTTTIIFKKPSGTNLTKTASFVTDGTDGLLRYVSVDGDIDEIGTWKIQASVTTPAGTWTSSFESFKVYRNI